MTNKGPDIPSYGADDSSTCFAQAVRRSSTQPFISPSLAAMPLNLSCARPRWNTVASHCQLFNVRLASTTTPYETPLDVTHVNEMVMRAARRVVTLIVGLDLPNYKKNLKIFRYITFT